MVPIGGTVGLQMDIFSFFSFSSTSNFSGSPVTPISSDSFYFL